MKRLAFTLAAASALALTATPALAHEPETIAAAVAVPDRPEEARALDEIRKPAETLAFLGLEEGMVAADLIPGNGYWSEIMAHVVGPTGSVVALHPQQFSTSEEAVAGWAALLERAPGVSLIRYPFEKFAYEADSLDFAIMNLNYHDIYWTSERYDIPFTDPDAYVAALFSAMKPGGIVGIIDHTGQPGDTREVVDATHRIDPDVVKADFERAGFVLVATSDILANPEDDLSVNVFDPAVRGKTDRFLFKFVKPL
ncbi:class I SAM-dependent methyltransferase [Erythrobacter sp. GH1-10]|uniref:class I SAM-dependent methyltransferase n=1 Tax=Erythrobacter sp. GH1-10 TaxID=3349334 RepID=UPI003877EF4E